MTNWNPPNQGPYGQQPPANPGWPQQPPQGYGPPPMNYPMPPGQPGGMSFKKKLLLGVIGGVAVSCVSLIAIVAYLQAEDEKTFGALGVACDGRPVAGSRLFTPGSPPGSHRFVGFRRRTDGTWSVSQGLVPIGDQRATGVADADVVICANDESRMTLDTCTFWENVRERRVTRMRERVVQRSQAQLPLRAMAASTGAPLAQATVQGSVPHVCGEFSGSRPTAGDYEGGSVGGSEIGTWLRMNNL